uniref:Serine/threonine-protein kinase ATM n=1 Tax=Vitis vinifera TaxID=29760 RepID=F6GSQ7_VITVI
MGLLNAVFMMCTVSALDPCQRELVLAALDNLSRKLQYTTRSKYLEELIGSILFCWVTCGVSLVALVEIRDHFVPSVEPTYFMQYCCHWLLPALLLHGDTSNLKWVASVAGLPLAVLVKNHFVPIFSVCMALHCSKKSGWEKGAVVLQSSILHVAEISEDERDKLIKKYMVSIVSNILSLASCASEPALPFFSRDTIVLAIRNVVDGFLEMEDCPTSVGVVDKINIFRSDRVFMFIVEMHYKVTAAVHHRHKCHRLADIEVLIDVLGHRAAVSSTSNYLFNLVGQFFGFNALQDQCSRIISMLLESFKSNPSKEIIGVPGEQLQFLVSKLVACCIPSETNAELSGTRSSQVLSLLHQLTIGADPSLYDYIRELEPFPEIDIFDEIREFHQELCRAYSPKDHFLKVDCLQHLNNLHHCQNMAFSPNQFLFFMECSLSVCEEIFLPSTKITFVESSSTSQEITFHMCGSDDANSVRALVSDFISRV